MDAELWRQVEDIYHRVLEIEVTERADFLRKACQGNEVLRREVESLLAYEKDAGQFIESPAIEIAGRWMGGEARDPAEAVTSETQPLSSGAANDMIGPYRLLELIGQGGMGEVWLAEQKEPVRRRVAIKLIKAGMDTREVIARFQSERQALAMMDHPAIAKVFDAGSTASGRPYFVMEYVPGLPITSYCDRQKLSLRSRLELFIQVCEGVQHAHQKAIIHRDLKPSNILVTEVDGRPMVRIIDFGIAKATSQQLTPDTIFTRFGSIVGTVGYISPEQADSAGQDIDTRSDVYSLGVILYELLAGALPLDFHQLAYDEILRCLREQDPPRPSTKVQTGDGNSTAAAQNRGVDPPSLARQLRGDPDAIALKALEKDRKRRYSSASELAADIGRFLRNEPVNAHAASVGYRASKYVRRHWLGVAFATTAVLLLAGFAVVQAIELQRIKQERDRADREAQASSRVADFLTGVFSIPNPTESRGNSVTARELLDKASADIEKGLGQDTQVQSRLMRTMGKTYLGLGLYAPGRRLLEQAVGIQTRALGAEAPETLLSSMSLGRAYQLQGNYDDAEKLLRQTAAAQARVLGPTDEKTMETVDFLANTLTKESHYAEAEGLLRRNLADQQRVLGAESVPAMNSMNHLVANLRGQGRLPEAEKLCRETLALRQRVSGPDDPATLSLINTLAILVEDQGRISEAEALYRQSLASLNRVLGPDHPNTLATYANLGRVAVEQNHLGEAERIFRVAMEKYSTTQGAEFPTTLALQENLGSVLGMERKLPESEKVLRGVAAIELRKAGPDAPATFHVEEDLALTLAKEGSAAEADSLYKKALVAATHSEGPEVSDALYNYAVGMAILGRREEAFQRLQEALDRGFSNADQLAGEADLQSLHKDPRFAILLSKARQAAANHH